MAHVQTESVLVIPTELFIQLGYFQGFSTQVDRYLPELFSPQQTSYRPRHEVEGDPGFKQLIPYVIFRHCDSQGRVRLFQYTRGKGQGEGRLHDKRSIGVGGHISMDDSQVGSVAAAYQEGMRRELAEEVSLDTPYAERCAGLINDDETEVGRVHLGVVHVFDVQRPLVRPLEREIVDAGFRSLEEIRSDPRDLESWSRICLDALFGDE